MNHPAHHGPTVTPKRRHPDSTGAAPVGIVIATRNRRASLAVTVRNLLALPERPDVLVVDNASTDDTRAMLARDFPQVRVLPCRTTAAPSPAPTACAPSTPRTSRSATTTPGGRRAPSAPPPGTSTTTPGSACSPPAPSSAPATPPTPQRPARRLPLGTATDLPGTQVLGFLGCAAVARRTAYLDAGGYHPLLFFGGEETLLAYDLAARGWGVTHCPDVIAHHHPHPRPRTGRPAVVRRNALLTAWLRRPLPHALARTRALAADARRDPHARHALRETLTRLPAALRARRPLPPHVERAARLLDGADGPDGPGGAVS